MDALPSKEEYDRITGEIIAAAMKVHRALGPGLLESAYEACLAFELRERGLRVAQQRPLPLVYGDVRLECGYRLDLVVEECVLVELKAVEHHQAIFDAQVISYLRLTGLRVGLLLNFHMELLKEGLRRYANDFPYSDSQRPQRPQR